MNNGIKIAPKKLEGEIEIPPSKSIAHRAIICAALSSGISRIYNIDYSDDIIATINAMRQLGAQISREDTKLIIDGSNTLKNMKKEVKIDCNESGSTLRFVIPVSITRNNEVRFIGNGNLGNRPLDTYYNIFEEKGIEYNYKINVLDLYINGSLQNGDFKIPGNISSQFITGLLFALPILEKDSKIIITTTLESRGYIDLTLDVMEKFGVVVENKDYKEFVIKGNQKYKALDYYVEGDYSQGAFYLCAGALGNKITCKNLQWETLQGDRECIDILKKMGVYINRSIDENTISISGGEGELIGTVIDASQCPDIIPVLTVVAALSKGESKVINGKRLRIKECDRLYAICSELNKIGAHIEELEDGLIINGVDYLKGGIVNSHKDHRIAMSLAIASTKCEGDLFLQEPQCVKKSYPHFWKDFISLGGEINNEWSLG